MIYVKAGIISKKKHRYFFIHEDKIVSRLSIDFSKIGKILLFYSRIYSALYLYEFNIGISFFFFRKHSCYVK